MLQAIQTEFGYLCEENIRYVALKLKISLAHIYGVATFYTQFKFEKQGKYKIQVCKGTACHVSGGEKILDYLKRKLNILEKGTTNDGLFSLEAVNCVGACAIAPVMVINEKTYGNLTIEKIDKIFEEYK
jgi:NADH-quinone oxidoreductase E subunit